MTGAATMTRGNRRPGLLSRAPEKRWPDGVVHHGARWLLIVALAAGLVMMYPSDPGVGIGRHRVGTVAARDIIAELDFQVPKDSAELRREREEAEAAVVPTFVFEEHARDSSLSALGVFFSRVDSAGPPTAWRGSAPYWRPWRSMQRWSRSTFWPTDAGRPP